MTDVRCFFPEDAWDNAVIAGWGSDTLSFAAFLQALVDMGALEVESEHWRYVNADHSAVEAETRRERLVSPWVPSTQTKEG